MKKEKNNQQLSTPGCFVLGLIAITPGVLLSVAMMADITWLCYLIMIPALVICILLLLAGLTSYKTELKYIFDNLMFMYFLNNIFGRKK